VPYYATVKVPVTVNVASCLHPGAGDTEFVPGAAVIQAHAGTEIYTTPEPPLPDIPFPPGF